MNIGFPFRIDERCNAAEPDDATHIRQMIEQVLFTIPGERVNRPDFGCGLTQLVFAPNSPELATATQFMVQGALQKWLGDRIQINEVTVRADDATIIVEVVYILIVNRTIRKESFTNAL